MEIIAEELGFENINIEDAPRNTYSTFCKLNPEGFKGKKLEKKGFLIGPTIPERKEDEDIPPYYSIFSPKVYFRVEPSNNSISQYRLIVIWVESFTFVILLEEDKFRLSFEVYEKMRNFIFEKAKNMFKKIDQIVEYNDEKPLDVEDNMKLIYYNESNLAIKQTVKFTKKTLTKEIRHYINVIRDKFHTNKLLREFQLTSTNHWIIGRRSLPRMVIAILPISLSQEQAELEAENIVNSYFSFL